MTTSIYEIFEHADKLWGKGNLDRLKGFKQWLSPDESN